MYDIINVPVEEAYQKVKDYEYALLYMISSVNLCRTEELESVDWDECMEARFFSDKEEMHIFECDGQMMAVEVKDSGEKKDTIVKKYPMNQKFQGVGDKLCVKEYITYDEDGQMQVALTRLCGIER